MWISGEFPTGGNFKYRVRRYDTTLEVAFSNDPTEGEKQMRVFNDWIERNTTSYGCLFNKLEELCNTCESGKELITKMKMI